MRELRINDICVKLNLDNGLYVLPSDGAVGKTYLGKLFCTAEANGMGDVICITYNLHLAEEDILRRLAVIKTGVLLMDRFDLYKTKAIVQQLRQISKSAVVLVDVKNLNSVQLGEYRFAWMNRTGEGDIEVGYESYI